MKNLSATDGAVVTLYAQWRANTYTIKYNGNNATSGKMSAQTLRLYGKSYTLSKNAFKRTGYKFTGWNTKKNGKGTSYKNRASVRNLTSVNGKTVTLYAQWKANKYIVKFHGNGATSGSMKKMTNCSYGKKYRLTTNKFKKKGYKFVGWNTKKNGKGKMYKNKAKIKNLTPKNGKTITLYAQWIEGSYMIHYDANGGIGAPPSHEEVIGKTGRIRPFKNAMGTRKKSNKVNTEENQMEFFGFTLFGSFSGGALMAVAAVIFVVGLVLPSRINLALLEFKVGSSACFTTCSE